MTKENTALRRNVVRGPPTPAPAYSSLPPCRFFAQRLTTTSARTRTPLISEEPLKPSSRV